MIKNILMLVITIAVLTFFGKSLKAQFGELDPTEINAPIVVELFTSQSCSSCPPADKNLTALATNPNVIALGFHVTYWDHLHWKDTLGDDLSTDRQRNYAAYRNTRRTYTPQMIINGEKEFIGSDVNKLNRALKSANDIKKISLSLDGDLIKVAIPDFPKSSTKETQFWLYGVKKSHTQNIPKGENKGRTVLYTDAVLHEQYYSRTGQSRSFKIQKPYEWNDIDLFVLIAQENKFGKIIAAGKTR